MRTLNAMIGLAAIILLCSCAGPESSRTSAHKTADLQGWQLTASTTIAESMTTLKGTSDSGELMVLTNAGYGQVNGNSTEALADIAIEQTGCSIGTGSLLFVHAAESAPLWFVLFRRDTGDAVFAKWTGESFQTQTLNLHPDYILKPDAWQETSAGLVSGNLFQVASFCLVWSADPSWGLLKSAELHNHICPGVNAGYIVAQHIRQNMPLRSGEHYVLVSAPPACPADALQTALDCTAGKGGIFTMKVSSDTLAEHGMIDTKPVVIAVRVNSQTDTCDGAVLGLDWQTACSELDMQYSDFSPPGGHSNPLFYIVRAKAAWQMARLPMETKLEWVRTIRQFSGDSALADRIANAGADPYAPLTEAQ